MNAKSIADDVAPQIHEAAERRELRRLLDKYAADPSEQLHVLRDEFYAALIVMRNYYAQAISRSAVDEVLERGWKLIKQTDDVLRHSAPEA